MTDVIRRRSLLAATGTALALAGCLDAIDDDASEDADDDDADIEWQEASIEDVTTGEEFTIAGIDRPIVIHTFAAFCPTCNNHQDMVTDEYDSVSDDMEFVDLAVEGANDSESLREHAESNGHEWRFGIASDAVTSSMVDEFGQDVGIHHQSPLIIVCPDGTTNEIDKPADITTIRSAVNSAC